MTENQEDKGRKEESIYKSSPWCNKAIPSRLSLLLREALSILYILQTFSSLMAHKAATVGETHGVQASPCENHQCA